MEFTVSRTSTQGVAAEDLSVKKELQVDDNTFALIQVLEKIAAAIQRSSPQEPA